MHSDGIGHVGNRAKKLLSRHCHRSIERNFLATGAVGAAGIRDHWRFAAGGALGDELAENRESLGGGKGIAVALLETCVIADRRRERFHIGGVPGPISRVIGIKPSSTAGGDESHVVEMPHETDVVFP